MKNTKFARWTIRILFFLTMFSFAQQYNESNDFSFALKAYNEKFYDIAAQQFTTFINRYPNSDRVPDAQFYNGDALYKIDEIENARIEFQTLAVTFPEHGRAPEAWEMVGRCSRALGKLQQAANAFETVKTLYPSHALAPPSLLAAAELMMEIGNLTRSEQMLHDFIDRYVSSAYYPRGRIVYGNLLLKKGEYERAGAEFEKVASITENRDFRAEALLGRADVSRKLGLVRQAESMLTEAVKTYSGSEAGFKAVLSLARLKMESGDYDAALAGLRLAATSYSGRDQKRLISLNMGRASFLKKDYLLAGREFSGFAADQDQVGRLATLYLGCTRLEEKQYDAAIAGFDRVLKNDPDDLGAEEKALALYGLSRAYINKGDIAPARVAVARFQETGASLAAAEQLHADLIQTAFARNQLSAGVDELQRFRGAYAHSPMRDDLIARAGEAFFESGQYERSLIFFEQVADEYPSSAALSSSESYINFLKTYQISSGKSAASELARLMGKLLMGEDRNNLLFDLGIIYLNDMHDFDEASAIFKRFVSASADSALTGKGLYYLSESYLKQSYYLGFLNQPYSEAEANAEASLKSAMHYVKYAPHPDTLTYWFLVNSTATGESAEGLSPDRQMKYWKTFESNYPKSGLLPEVYMRLAQFAGGAGDLQTRQTYLEKAVAQSKDKRIAGSAQVALAELYQQAGSTDRAIELLKEFILNYDKHPLQAAAHTKLAEMFEKKGEYSIAAQFLERLVELHDYSDESARAPGLIAGDFIKSGEYGKALGYIEKGLQSESLSEDLLVQQYFKTPSLPLYFYAGKAYYQQEDDAPARQRILTFISLSPRSALTNEALYLLGEIANRNGDTESALVQFSLLDKTLDPANYYLGNKRAAAIMYQTGNYDGAIKKYDELISLPESADDKIFLEAQKIYCLINQGKTSLADSREAAFKKSFGKHADRDNYLAGFEIENGKAAYGKKQFDTAIKHFKTVRGKYKKSDYADDAQYQIARSLATLNKTEDAQKEIEKFLKDYPGSDLTGNIYLLKAEIHFLDNDTDAGLAAVLAAVEKSVHPDTRRSALALLINTYENLGLWDGALQKTREYIRSYPNAEDLMDRKIAIGIQMSRLNRYTEAIEYLRNLKFEVNSEQEPEIQFYIGESYYNSGQYESAVNELVKIPLLSKRTKLQWEASAFYLAGQSYEKLGQRDQALRMYQEIIDRPGIQLDFKREARKLIDNLNRLN